MLKMKNLLILVLLLDSTITKAGSINGVINRNISDAIAQETKARVLKNQKAEKSILDDQVNYPEKIKKIKNKLAKKVK